MQKLFNVIKSKDNFLKNLQKTTLVFFMITLHINTVIELIVNGCDFLSIVLYHDGWKSQQPN